MGDEKVVALPADEVFSLVYEDCYPSIVKFAYAIVLDHEQASNLAHEAFLRLWERRADAVERGNEKAWLRRVVVNLALSYRRRLRVAVRHRLSPGLGPDPADVAVLALQVSEVHHAMRRLSPRERAVLGLRFEQGCTFPEIAQILGIPDSTVRTQVARSIAKLRNVLNSPAPAESRTEPMAEVQGG